MKRLQQPTKSAYDKKLTGKVTHKGKIVNTAMDTLATDAVVAIIKALKDPFPWLTKECAHLGDITC